MNKEQTQIQFEAETFMHEYENEVAVQRQHENRCMACNGSGVAHWIDATTGEEVCEPCPNCQTKEDYMDVYAEPPRRK